MVYIMPLVPLTSLFSSPSSSSRVSSASSLSASSSSPASTTGSHVHSEGKQQGSVQDTSSSTCKRTSQRRKGTTATANVLFLFLLDLWGVVPLIILITTTSILTNNVSSAVSIAAVSFNSTAYVNGRGNGAANSGNFVGNHHQKPSHSPQPSKLSLVTGNDAKGNGTTAGTLNLALGQLHFVNKVDDQEQETKRNLKAIKSKGILRKRNKRNSIGDTRITSNQDVTTLALAVDNSSSVAIANINSSFNSVFVSIGQNNFPSHNRFDQINQSPSYDDEDD